MNPFDSSSLSELSQIRETPAKIISVVQAYRAATAKIRADWTLSPIYAQQKADTARQDALTNLQSVFGMATLQKATIDRAIAATLNPGPADSNAAIAQELRFSRIWERTRRLLDSGLPFQTVLQDAAEAGDVDTFLVLRQELSPWLTANNSGQRDPVRDEIVRSSLAYLDQAELPILSPVQRSARAASAEVEVGYYNTVCSRAMAESEIQGNGQQSVYPGWTRASGISTTTT